MLAAESQQRQSFAAVLTMASLSLGDLTAAGWPCPASGFRCSALSACCQSTRAAPHLCLLAMGPDVLVTCYMAGGLRNTGRVHVGYSFHAGTRCEVCVELHVCKSPHALEANVRRAQLFHKLGARISLACCCLAGRDTTMTSASVFASLPHWSLTRLRTLGDSDSMAGR